MDALVNELEAALRAAEQDEDASHDIFHARRVRQYALEIAEKEGAGDPVVLTAAAYLHDLINLPKNHPQREMASTFSAEAAGPILTRAGLSDEQIKAAQHAIEAHSFSAGIEPQTLEAKIIQDADRLEALGAIGIARTFYIAAKLGGGLFDGGDPFGEHRRLDDKTFAVDHFPIKLLRLSQTMCTNAGREVAEERTRFMVDFLKQLGRETGFDYKA
ncbi:HD domain-containing protein [Rhodobacteraceae bacterium RKSG542]|nr:HD domain-containing protein [Pseudovibrio flavus]